jgi:hypothetical protein
MSSLVHRFIQPLRSSPGLFRAICSAFHLPRIIYQQALHDPSAVEGWRAGTLQRSVRFSPAAARSKWLAVLEG